MVCFSLKVQKPGTGKREITSSPQWSGTKIIITFVHHTYGWSESM